MRVATDSPELTVRRTAFAAAVLAAGIAWIPGCYSLQGSEGGGQVRFDGTREVDAADVSVPDGYAVEAVVTGLTFPTGVAVDVSGNLFVTEAGYSYGAEAGTARLTVFRPDGTSDVLAESDNPPWNGVVYHHGALFVAGGHVREGEVLRISMEGEVTPLATGLPSLGDHHTNGPAVGADGYVYFGQGTATNAAVVGVDNHEFGWLAKHPEFHDVPCEDITLTGRNYESDNPLTPGSDPVSTGAYVPIGTATAEGQVIAGTVPCSGAILRVPADGGEMELVAWGLRNPFGLAFAPDGALYVTENGFDDRGSRQVWGTGDYLWRIEEGTWYGFPDFAGGVPISAFAVWDRGPRPGRSPRPASPFRLHPRRVSGRTAPESWRSRTRKRRAATPAPRMREDASNMAATPSFRRRIRRAITTSIRQLVDTTPCCDTSTLRFPAISSCGSRRKAATACTRSNRT